LGADITKNKFDPEWYKNSILKKMPELERTIISENILKRSNLN
jgi:hypothetical protein